MTNKKISEKCECGGEAVFFKWDNNPKNVSIPILKCKRCGDTFDSHYKFWKKEPIVGNEKIIKLEEMKRRCKKAGRHFFDRGNPAVLAKRGNYLVTRSFGGDSFVVYKFNLKNAHFYVKCYAPTKNAAIIKAEDLSGVRR